MSKNGIQSEIYGGDIKHLVVRTKFIVLQEMFKKIHPKPEKTSNTQARAEKSGSKVKISCNTLVREKFLAKFENQSGIYGRVTSFKIEHFVNSSKKVVQNAKKCPNKGVEGIFKKLPQNLKNHAIHR